MAHSQPQFRRPSHNLHYQRRLPEHWPLVRDVTVIVPEQQSDSFLESCAST
jgi:hypothetical protein